MWINISRRASLVEKVYIQWQHMLHIFNNKIVVVIGPTIVIIDSTGTVQPCSDGQCLSEVGRSLSEVFLLFNIEVCHIENDK